MKNSLCFVFENNSVSKIHYQWYCACLSTDMLLKVSEVAQIFIEGPFHLLWNASADSKEQDPSILSSAVAGECYAALQSQ